MTKAGQTCSGLPLNTDAACQARHHIANDSGSLLATVARSTTVAVTARQHGAREATASSVSSAGQRVERATIAAARQHAQWTTVSAAGQHVEWAAIAAAAGEYVERAAITTARKHVEWSAAAALSGAGECVGVLLLVARGLLVVAVTAAKKAHWRGEEISWATVGVRASLASLVCLVAWHWESGGQRQRGESEGESTHLERVWMF